ncbi:MAG TPA: hypothetical protein VD866_07010, partial [Urbifossiella sp.]|nr:hypothetical protein [Urbifossiella sp.]
MSDTTEALSAAAGDAVRRIQGRALFLPEGEVAVRGTVMKAADAPFVLNWRVQSGPALVFLSTAAPDGPPQVRRIG